jgi:hypothetical protein
MAFRSFRLSGHSGGFLVVPVTENKKILKKGEAPRTIRRMLPIDKESAYGQKYVF